MDLRGDACGRHGPAKSGLPKRQVRSAPRAAARLRGRRGKRMPEFDPRPASLRLALGLLVGAAGLVFLGLAWSFAAGGRPSSHDPAAKPLAKASAQPSYAGPINVALKVERGETFEAAVRRSGVAADEAH